MMESKESTVVMVKLRPLDLNCNIKIASRDRVKRECLLLPIVNQCIKSQSGSSNPGRYNYLDEHPRLIC